MVTVPDIQIDLTELNHTELVLLANWSDLGASRAFPRETIIQALESMQPLELPRPMEDMQSSLNQWLERWWDVVRMQVPKKACPECFECRDLQVLDCYRRNEKNIKPERG